MLEPPTVAPPAPAKPSGKPSVGKASRGKKGAAQQRGEQGDERGDGLGDWRWREGAAAAAAPCREGDSLLHVACRAGQLGSLEHLWEVLRSRQEICLRFGLMTAGQPLGSLQGPLGPRLANPISGDELIHAAAASGSIPCLEFILKVCEGLVRIGAAGMSAARQNLRWLEQAAAPVVRMLGAQPLGSSRRCCFLSRVWWRLRRRPRRQQPRPPSVPSGPRDCAARSSWTPPPTSSGPTTLQATLGHHLRRRGSRKGQRCGGPRRGPGARRRGLRTVALQAAAVPRAAAVRRLRLGGSQKQPAPAAPMRSALL